MRWVYILCLFAPATVATICDPKLVEIVNSGNTTWEAGQNFAPDTSLKYIRNQLGYIESETRYNNLFVRTWHEIPDILVPKEFDARKKWPKCPTISHINDQGNCGSCWAVSTASAFSDRVCIASNQSITAPYSSQNLLSCCSECGNGCLGGNPEMAWNYLVMHGIVTGGDYHSNNGCQPYQFLPCEHFVEGPRPPCESLPEENTPKCANNCINPHYEKDFNKDIMKGFKLLVNFNQNYPNLIAKTAYTLQNVIAIQKEVMINGPVVAGFEIFYDFLCYKSGIYQHVTGNYFGGHAVRIIGWGEENGTPYWLITNSWNKDWGQNGLFKIRRGNDECGIEKRITAGEIDV